MAADIQDSDFTKGLSFTEALEAVRSVLSAAHDWLMDLEGRPEADGYQRVLLASAQHLIADAIAETETAEGMSRLDPKVVR